MNSQIYERVHDNLKRLKLMTIESILDDQLELAAKENKRPLRFLITS